MTRFGRGILLAALLSPCWSLNLAKNLKRLRDIAPYFDDAVSREVSGNRRNRIYANTSKLVHLSGPVTHDQIITPQKEAFRVTADTVWITIPYRVTILCLGYFMFPNLIESLRGALPPAASPNDVPALTSGFTPAISLLYGAWLGLTFNILEERIGKLQRTATIESSRLCSLCERSAQLASGAPKKIRVPLLRCLFEQTSMLAVQSREEEIISIANSNSIYWKYRYELQELEAFLALSSKKDSSAGILALHDAMDELVVVRATRLSMETKSLPGAHFAILAIFSLQLLASFVYAIAQSPVTPTDPALRVAFSFCAAVFLLVFNFSIDLNDPFRGNYQIRRSAINANLLAARRCIADAVGEDLAALWISDLDDRRPE